MTEQNEQYQNLTQQMAAVGQPPQPAPTEDAKAFFRERQAAWREEATKHVAIALCQHRGIDPHEPRTVGDDTPRWTQFKGQGAEWIAIIEAVMKFGPPPGAMDGDDK